MNSLPLFHKVKGTKVVVVGEGEEAAAKARLIKRAGGTVCSEAEAHLAKLAFVALEDEAAAIRAATRLKERGLIVNVVDRPHLCEFTTPSLLERDPVLIAVGTGGASAGLAKHVRLRIENLLPASLGDLAKKLAASRKAIRERWPDGADRRRTLDTALSPGGALDPLAGDAAERVDNWLADRDGSEAEESGPQAASSTETIILRSDDPDDLTLREARWLGMADCVLHADTVPEGILIRARADAVRKIWTVADGENGRRPDRAANEVHGSTAGLTVMIK
jgi:uroporphyrin-III C-methyltransferase/precorrin-2 dehydrogenase/sirohydrochlorin ferrochelatase